MGALRDPSPEEQARVVNLLVRRHNQDWPEIQALDVNGSNRAREMIREGSTGSDGIVRIASAIKLNRRGLLNDTEIETASLEISWTITKLGEFIWVGGLILVHPPPVVIRMLPLNTING